MLGGPHISRRAVVAGAILSAAAPLHARADEQTPVAPATPLTLTEQLLYTTARIECRDQFSDQTSFGTAFFFSLFLHNERHVPILVTNKHVLKRPADKFAATSCSVKLTVKSADGRPNVKEHMDISLPGSHDTWLPHPDPNVDLIMLPFQDIHASASATGREPFYKTIRPDFVMTDDELLALNPAEDTLVIGYPLGLSDTVNNLPILRRGITATSPAHDFDGRTEFLIDAPIFVGSSGSPVFLYNRGAWAERGSPRLGERVKLLGIVWGVESQRMQGDILFVPAPTQLQSPLRAVPQVEIPANLGLCIKASRLFDFEPLMISQGFKAPEGYKSRAKS